jgi:hypothetical protein
MLEAALLRRMGLDTLGEKTLGPLAMEHGASMRATHALDLCRAALEFEGHDVPHGREEMVRASLTTYSLRRRCGNVANKLLVIPRGEAAGHLANVLRGALGGELPRAHCDRPSLTGALQLVAPAGN